MNVLLCLLVICSVVGIAIADTKHCYCKVVASDNSNNVIHDFGQITKHTHWLSVGCRRLHACPDECDKRVKDWVCNEQASCKTKTGGKSVVSYYKSSTCGEKAGSDIRTCKCTGGVYDEISNCQLKCLSEGDVGQFMQCFNDCMYD